MRDAGGHDAAYQVGGHGDAGGGGGGGGVPQGKAVVVAFCISHFDNLIDSYPHLRFCRVVGVAAVGIGGGQVVEQVGMRRGAATGSGVAAGIDGAACCALGADVSICQHAAVGGHVQLGAGAGVHQHGELGGGVAQAEGEAGGGGAVAIGAVVQAGDGEELVVVAVVVNLQDAQAAVGLPGAGGVFALQVEVAQAQGEGVAAAVVPLRFASQVADGDVTSGWAERIVGVVGGAGQVEGGIGFGYAAAGCAADFGTYSYHGLRRHLVPCRDGGEVGASVVRTCFILCVFSAEGLERRSQPDGGFGIHSFKGVVLSVAVGVVNAVGGAGGEGADEGAGGGHQAEYLHSPSINRGGV